MSTITDPALTENNVTVERYTTAWQVVPKGDAFNDLCLSIIYSQDVSSKIQIA